MCCASLLETVTGGRLLLVNRVSEGLGPRTEASEFVPALSPPPMPKHRFQIGDKVRVTGMSPVTFPLGAKDELGTEKLLKNMLGKVYTVQGLDKYGNLELEPKRLNIVWVEPEYLKLVARKAKKTHAK